MGTLYIVATAIGNMEDITIRAIKTLFDVDIIACEDSRKTGNLIQNLELRIKNREISISDLDINKKPKLISYYDEVEELKTPEIIQLLEENKDVALVSDAGTPLIADPGYKLVRECINKGINVVSIPGPSSVISSLVSSGLPANQVIFLGYLSNKPKRRKELLNDLYRLIDQSIQIKPSVAFFVSPHHLKGNLADLKEAFGDIEIVIARELTKIHEEIWRGKISEAQEKDFKGELVILLK